MPNFKDPEIYRTILESLDTGIYVVDQRIVLFWNDGAERITGYLRQDMLGRPWQENLASPENGRSEALADPAGAVRRTVGSRLHCAVPE